MVLADWQVERDVGIDPFVKGQQAKGVVSYGLGSYGYDMRVGHKFRVFTNTYSTVVDVKDFDDRAFVDVDLVVSRHDWRVGPASGGEFRCSKCDMTTRYPGSFVDGCIQLPNFVLIPPNSFALGESVETFKIPRDVLGLVIGKSTYARAGIIVNVTPMEPEWQGKLTVEISNTTPLPAKIYAGEGIAQAYFLRSDGHAEAVMNAVRRLCDRQQLHENWPIRVAYLEEMLARELGGGACKVSYADRKGRYQAQAGLTLPFVQKEGDS